MGKNAIVGQSGGPTSVINASLAGVFESCKSRGAEIVYGMCNGVAGLLEERVVDLSTVLTDDLDIELLKRTPSSFLGSCRYKLPDWHDDETVYKKLFAILEKLNIGYFFYIGGNDSMDTIGKLAEYGCEMTFHKVCDDDPAGITAAILEAKAAGCELIFTTGGMSVDPDDRTPLAIRNTGAEIITYGAPVLPGAMFLVSYLDGVPVCGLPGCVMYAKRTIFDLLLPRLLADDAITAEDIARLGEGGLCLNCKVCTWPNCGFGKGV